jgi:enolase
VSRIAEVSLRRIFDSRGADTCEATVVTDAGGVGVAGAPSGASTGTHEVRAWPEGGVDAALTLFREQVRERLEGLEVADQEGVDRTLHSVDGTPNFSRIGGNTATALSVASALARADEEVEPLWRLIARAPGSPERFPAIVGNCLNGGRHAIGGPDIQEFHAVALDPKPERSVPAALEVHRAVGRALREKYPTLALGRGDEGGWVAPIGNAEAVELLATACAQVRDASGVDVRPGLDLAATEFFRDGRYRYREQTLDAEGQLGFVQGLIDRHGLVYVEDPFQEEDFDSFAALTKAVGARARVVGDDLYTTSEERVRRGLERQSTNAVLIKVNQVGTLTDTLRTVDLARAHRWDTVTSHRSGEVAQGWLASLAVAFGSWGLKCGLLGGERVAKLNELLRLAATPEMRG